MARLVAADFIKPNGSIYAAMFRAGKYGIPFEDCESICDYYGINIRAKDVRSWTDGANVGVRIKSAMNSLSPRITTVNTRKQFPKLTDFPVDFNTTIMHKSFFPCNWENKPMQKWGYSEGFDPELMDISSALLLSDVGFIGFNMLMQNFIVIDIDGVGHGDKDEQVIKWGRKWSSQTETWEDPHKVGSFHLYFLTNRLIPTMHYPEAKIDILGNAKNTACYRKNKQSNGRPMMYLTSAIWKDLMDYVQSRKEN